MALYFDLFPLLWLNWLVICLPAHLPYYSMNVSELGLFLLSSTGLSIY